MEVTLQNLGQVPEWASQRGHMVKFTMDFCAKGTRFRKGRTLAAQGEKAYILSDYLGADKTVSVQPMDRYYPIHNVPIEILESLCQHITNIVEP